LLAGTLELMMTGGVNPGLPAEVKVKAISSRTRGLKQGLFIFLLTFLVVPILVIITVATNSEPFAVVIASILLGVGGLLRMAYAMLFESSATGVGKTEANSVESFLFERRSNRRDLPPAQNPPVPSYASPAAGSWKDTKELEPTSVTEGTTRLLESEKFDQ